VAPYGRNLTGGEAIPLSMRVVHLSHDVEAIARVHSPGRGWRRRASAGTRPVTPPRPTCSWSTAPPGSSGWTRWSPGTRCWTWSPEPHRVLEGQALDDALAVAADFIDLKSPFMSGHSRRAAQLATDAAQVLGFSGDEVAQVRRAALVHDFGTTAAPKSIWDKPGTLTKAEFDRVELHPMLTEQMLRRSRALAVLNPVASAHHEKSDGSGYHKRVRAIAVDPGARVLAAAEICVGMTTDRADREACSAEQAAAELRGLASRGLTTQQTAVRLSIPPKTTDHHIQHIYGKIGVSTRAAAALWGTQHAVVA